MRRKKPTTQKPNLDRVVDEEYNKRFSRVWKNKFRRLHITPAIANAYPVSFSAENVVYGQGGALLQILDRDTCKFAMKASAALIDGKWVDVYKDPVGDTSKRSKKGRLMLYRNRETGAIFTDIEIDFLMDNYEPLLQTVWENGKLIKEYTFAEVRANAERG